MFITAAEEFGAQIIGLSALMSTTMPSQKEVIDFLEAKGLRNKYKVIVGGGPVTPQWAEQIGARRLLQGRRGSGGTREEPLEVSGFGGFE